MWKLVSSIKKSEKCEIFPEFWNSGKKKDVKRHSKLVTSMEKKLFIALFYLLLGNFLCFSFSFNLIIWGVTFYISEFSQDFYFCAGFIQYFLFGYWYKDNKYVYGKLIDMAITANVQKSFIMAITPVFSALFMKKREKNPKNHQMN